jgi:hypothetical protein
MLLSVLRHGTVFNDSHLPLAKWPLHFGMSVVSAPAGSIAIAAFTRPDCAGPAHSVQRQLSVFTISAAVTPQRYTSSHELARK